MLIHLLQLKMIFCAFLYHFRVLRHVICNPNVAANDRTSAYSDASEDGRLGVNHDVVLDYRMSRNAFYRVAVLVGGETFRTKRYALVDFDVVANYRRGANDYACAVVDGEVLTNLRLRMYVDASFAVRHFCDNSRQKWHFERVEQVRNSVVRDGANGGISKNNFAVADRGRVAVEDCFDVALKHSA